MATCKRGARAPAVPFSRGRALLSRGRTPRARPHPSGEGSFHPGSAVLWATLQVLNRACPRTGGILIQI
eukprot:7845395-Pyramimonas_sp.AAC.1